MENRIAKEVEILEESWEALESFVRKRRWRGPDPEDALASPLLQWVPIRPARSALARLVGEMPVNARPALFHATDHHDPKALSLFLRGYLRQAAASGKKSSKVMGTRAEQMFEMLAALPNVRSAGPQSWGFPFPWQGSKAEAKAWAPNAVCCAFVGEALLDLAEWRAAAGTPPFPKARLLGLNLPNAKKVRLEAWKLAWRTAVHAARLHPTTLVPDRGLAFHLVPKDRKVVCHVSLPLAAFLGRFAKAAHRRGGGKLARECDALARQTNSVEERHRLSKPWEGGSLAAECWGLAASAAMLGAKCQRPSGEWPVEIILDPPPKRNRRRLPKRHSKSAHASCNLIALKQLRADLWETRELAESLDEWKDPNKRDALFDRLDRALERGYRNYLQKFYREGSLFLFRQDRPNVLDSQAAARGALTLAAFGEHQAGREQLIRLIADMQDAREGSFYYQRRGEDKVHRIEYMRWSQAWVFWALAGLLAFSADTGGEPESSPENDSEVDQREMSAV